MRFEDLPEVMFTQALLDSPTDAWEVESEDGVPQSITHKKSQHKWALSDYDETQKCWVGRRVA